MNLLRTCLEFVDESVDPFHAAPGPQPGSKNVPYLRLPDPRRDNVQLQFITGYSSTDKAMYVNFHQIVLGNIQMSFCNPFM